MSTTNENELGASDLTSPRGDDKQLLRRSSRSRLSKQSEIEAEEPPPTSAAGAQQQNKVCYQNFQRFFLSKMKKII